VAASIVTRARFSIEPPQLMFEPGKVWHRFSHFNASAFLSKSDGFVIQRDADVNAKHSRHALKAGVPEAAGGRLGVIDAALRSN
jgi:hypothetical protein